jgi:hypothetical protein
MVERLLTRQCLSALLLLLFALLAFVRSCRPWSFSREPLGHSTGLIHSWISQNGHIHLPIKIRASPPRSIDPAVPFHDG